MQLSVEVSMYPLDANYEKPILDFIKRLQKHTLIKVQTNTMSTQIFGPYDAVMNAIQQEMKSTFLQEDKVVMVMKFINSDLSHEFKMPFSS